MLKKAGGNELWPVLRVLPVIGGDALHDSEALVGCKPGRKPKLDAKDRRIRELEQRAARLEAKLSLAEKLIDLQKKVSAILGINLATDEES